MKKYIKVREFCGDKGWREILCERKDDLDIELFEPMDSHKELCEMKDQHYWGLHVNTVTCPYGEYREVVWQADELPV